MHVQNVKGCNTIDNFNKLTKSNLLKTVISL